MGRDDILKSKLRGYHFADTKSSDGVFNSVSVLILMITLPQIIIRKFCSQQQQQ